MLQHTSDSLYGGDVQAGLGTQEGRVSPIAEGCPVGGKHV